ncbi:hypothetical protein LOZ65_002542 [Ophidiomyces ophidiicola]|nr:hypothetical protein LOZ65_002542 [Ophidiomyces ophidiicola]
MATLSATGLQPTTGSKDLVVELIWQHAVNHLKKTKNEIFLPVDISSLIGGDNIEKIKSRLSAMLNVPVVAFEDHANNIYRIMPTPALDGAIESTVAQLLPMMAAGEYGIQNLGERSSKQNVQPKSAKVPRPPNAFILYRQHHHPLIKAAHPEYHNNDISILLGKKWKSETAEVKAHFKTLAADIKRKHAEDHPDYQYTPRKPSEKKRRSASRRDGYFSAIKNTQVNHPLFSGKFASNSTPNRNGVDSSRDTSMPLENNDESKTPPTVIESDFDPLMMDRSASFVVGVDEGGFLTFHRRRRAPVSTSTTSSPPATTTATQATSNLLSGGSNPTEWNALDFDFDEYFAGTE